MNILGICSRITQLPHLLGGDIHGFHSFMSGNTKKKHIHPLPGKPWVHTTQKWDSQVSTKYHGSSRTFKELFPSGKKAFWLPNIAPASTWPWFFCWHLSHPLLTSLCSVPTRSCVTPGQGAPLLSIPQEALLLDAVFLYQWYKQKLLALTKSLLRWGFHSAFVKRQ